MMYIQKFWVQGGTGIVQGLVKKLTLPLLGAAFAVLLLAPVSARATGITQLEYIQWMVQVSGDTASFSASSSAADYVQWAQAKGVTPSGGWNPTAALTREVLAQTLVQLLNLSSSQKGGTDYQRILAREGIALPSEVAINRRGVVTILANISARIPGIVSPAKGNNGVGNGEDPPPPGWQKNFPDRPQNDRPGTGPGNPGNAHGG